MAAVDTCSPAVGEVVDDNGTYGDDGSKATTGLELNYFDTFYNITTITPKSSVEVAVVNREASTMNDVSGIPMVSGRMWEFLRHCSPLKSYVELAEELEEPIKEVGLLLYSI